MTDATRELLERALKLSDEERAQLASELFASLNPGDTDPSVAEAAWRPEIERRLDDARRDGSTYPLWEDTLQRAEQRLKDRRRSGE